MRVEADTKELNESIEERGLYGFKFRSVDKRRAKNADRQNAVVFDIKQLWQRQHEILNMALLGYKQSEIAKMLNISPVTVSNTLNSSLGMEALAEKRRNRDAEFEGFHHKVMDLTEKSLEVYNKILSASTNPADENFDPNVGLKMQKDTADTVVLELSGLRTPTKIDTRSVNMSLTSDEIEEFKRRGFEAARAAGNLVEVDDESEN